MTPSSVKVSYGWHQWQLPQSPKRLLAHSLVVVLTLITAKGADQFSGWATKNSCQLQRKGSRYPQGRTKHQRPTTLGWIAQLRLLDVRFLHGWTFCELWGSLLLRLACRNPASYKMAFFPIKLESGWNWKREDGRTEKREFSMTSALRTRRSLYPSIKSSTAIKVWGSQQNTGQWLELS